MNGKKKLKFILLGVVIIINVAVIGVVLSDPKEDIVRELKNEIEGSLSEQGKEVDNKVEDNKIEDIDNSNNSSNINDSNTNNNNSSSSSIDNNNINSNNSSSSINDNNTNSNNSSSTNNNNNTNSNNSSSTNTNNNTNSNNSSSTNTNNGDYQDEVVEKDKGYMNINESREFLQQVLNEKYSENEGVYINGIYLAYMLDGSLETEEGHKIFYIGYFLNDEKPPYNGQNGAHKLFRVATVNSITKEYTDFGYRNGRKYEELGFKSGPS